MKLQPAVYVIYMFQGSGVSLIKLAKLLGCSKANVSAWQHRTHKNKEKGSIPSQWHKKILKLAREYNLDIVPNDLIYGREVKTAYLEPDKNLKKQKFYF